MQSKLAEARSQSERRADSDIFANKKLAANKLGLQMYWIGRSLRKIYQRQYSIEEDIYLRENEITFGMRKTIHTRVHPHRCG
jgi:hypothetical protein